MKVKDFVDQLNRKGYVKISGLFNQKKIDLIKQKLERILYRRNQKKKFVGDYHNQILWNYFYDDKTLLSLIDIPLIDKILKKILEPNYVLQSSVAQSRSVLKNKLISKNKGNLGTTWHTDSRYLNNKRISKGFSYLVIIALDDFDNKNGTKYIPMSLNFNKKPKRFFDKSELSKLKPETLEMKSGTVCIMDTGIYHKAGNPSSKSRWSIFSIYTGWFVKPYFDYKKIFKKFKLRENQKKILHFYSKPPEIDQVRPVLSKSFDEK